MVVCFIPAFGRSHNPYWAVDNSQLATADAAVSVETESIQASMRYFLPAAYLNGTAHQSSIKYRIHCPSLSGLMQELLITGESSLLRFIIMSVTQPAGDSAMWQMGSLCMGPGVNRLCGAFNLLMSIFSLTLGLLSCCSDQVCVMLTV